MKFSLKEDTNIGPEHAGKYYVVVQSSEHSINFTSDNINDGGADAFGFIVGDTPENIAGLAEKHTNVYKESTKCHEAGLAGTIKVNGEPIVIKGTTTLAALVSSLEEKLGSGAQVEYKDGRFNITGLTGNVKLRVWRVI